MLPAHSADEGDNGHGILRHAMVRPGRVVHVSDSQLRPRGLEEETTHNSIYCGLHTAVLSSHLAVSVF